MKLMRGPGVSILRIPLSEPEMVQRAVNLPHQLARRYRHDTVELAMRVDDWRLAESGLEGFRVAAWGGAGSQPDVPDGDVRNVEDSDAHL